MAIHNKQEIEAAHSDFMKRYEGPDFAYRKNPQTPYHRSQAAIFDKIGKMPYAAKAAAHAEVENYKRIAKKHGYAEDSHLVRNTEYNIRAEHAGVPSMGESLGFKGQKVSKEGIRKWADDQRG